MVDAQALQGKVIFELQENSHLPVTPYSQQNDVTSLLTAFGGPIALGQMQEQYPALFRSLTRPFSSIQLGDETDDEISTLMLSRLQQMKEQFEGGVQDPQQLVDMIMPPISAYEPKLKDKADWCSRYLDLDSAQKSPMVLRQAVEAMYNQCMNLAAQLAMPQAATAGLTAGIGQAAAAAPAAIGAHLMGKDQAQHQAGLDAQQPQAGAPPEPPPAQKIAEGANYKDLPPDAQQAMLKQMGLPSSGTDDVHPAQVQMDVVSKQGENQVQAAKMRPKPAKKAVA
jgi:hypothetical protein